MITVALIFLQILSSYRHVLVYFFCDMTSSSFRASLCGVISLHLYPITTPLARRTRERGRGEDDPGQQVRHGGQEGGQQGEGGGHRQGTQHQLSGNVGQGAHLHPRQAWSRIHNPLLPLFKARLVIKILGPEGLFCLIIFFSYLAFLHIKSPKSHNVFFSPRRAFWSSFFSS